MVRKVMFAFGLLAVLGFGFSSSQAQASSSPPDNPIIAINSENAGTVVQSDQPAHFLVNAPAGTDSILKSLVVINDAGKNAGTVVQSDQPAHFLVNAPNYQLAVNSKPTLNNTGFQIIGNSFEVSAPSIVSHTFPNAADTFVSPTSIT